MYYSKKSVVICILSMFVLVSLLFYVGHVSSVSACQSGDRCMQQGAGRGLGPGPGMGRGLNRGYGFGSGPGGLNLQRGILQEPPY